MKRSVVLFFLLGLVGCGAAYHPTGTKPVLLKWTGDGNPLVPVCGAKQVNCKYAVKVIDKTTGVSTTIPLSSLSYQGQDQTHTYDVLIIGFDSKGQPMESECCEWKP